MDKTGPARSPHCHSAGPAAHCERQRRRPDRMSDLTARRAIDAASHIITAYGLSHTVATAALIAAHRAINTALGAGYRVADVHHRHGPRDHTPRAAHKTTRPRRPVTTI